MTLIYLASPYTSPSDLEREFRAAAAAKACALLTQMGIGHIYAPIVHGAAFERFLPHAIREDHNFWMQHCFEILDRCDGMIVLMIAGWDESKGVMMEIDRCAEKGKPAQYAVMDGNCTSIELLSPREVAVAP